jgi:HlyD family secretion protein
MTKRQITKITIPLFLLIAAAAAYAMFRGNRSDPSTEYYTAVVARGPIRKLVNATGVVQTVVTVPVGSQVSGQVQEIFADFNSVVKRGQLLAKLDPRNLEAAVATSTAQLAAAQARLRSAEAEIKTHAANIQSARANLEAARVTRDNAKLNFDRASELSQKGVASKNDFDTAKANYDSAAARFDQADASLAQVQAQSASTEAQIAQARAGLQQAQADLERSNVNLEYANIFSPVDGVVISRDVDVGQTIAASMSAPTLFSIATDLGQMQVKASVDEADIGAITEDAKVTFTVDAYTNDVFPGKIAEIRLNPQTVQNVVTYNVILSIDNPDLRLKPGMTANITIIVAEREDAVKIPNAALRYRPPDAPALPAEETNKPAPKATMTASPSVGAGISLPRAPGQRWDPDAKLRFPSQDMSETSPGTVWVVGPDQKAMEKKVTLGITDGAMTEMVVGDLKEGDEVIVADATQIDTQLQGSPQALGGTGRGNANAGQRRGNP